MTQSGSSSQRLFVSPSVAVLQINDSLPVEAGGGTPPYTYTIASGAGTLNGNVFKAPPTPGATRVEVRDNAGGVAAANFTIKPAGISLGITPSTQAVYTGGSVSFSAVGGTGPFEFSMGSNNSGGSVNPTSGVYTAGSNSGAGSVNDQVVITDTSDLTTATATVTVQAKPLSVSPDTITVYVNQSIDLSPIGGDGPFSFSITTNGSGATIVGDSYSAGPVPGTDTVTMVDNYDGRSASATITVVDTMSSVDYAPTPVINIVSSNVLTGSTFTADFSVENNGSAPGSKPVSWTMYASSDTSIGGVDDRIVATGTLAGTASGSTTPISVTSGTWPSEPGDYYLLVDLYAADDLSLGDNRSQSAGTTEIYAPITVSPSVASLYTGQSVDFAVSGGTGTYTYSFSQTGSGSASIVGDTYTAGNTPGTDIVEVRDTTYPGWAPATATIAVSSIPAPPPGDVEYVVSSFSSTNTTPDATSTIGESFVLKNNGVDPGSASVSWAAYLSQDNTPALSAGDQLIDTGTASPLDGDDGFSGGGDELSIPLGGQWPSNPGTYYLKVRETADDETSPNQWFVSGGFSVQSISSDVDYYVSSPPAGGVGVTLGDTVAASFVVTNQGADPGSATVYWWAYISSDTTYNGGDLLVDSGSLSPLPSETASASIPINNGTWNSAGTKYLLLRLQAADEVNSTNNISPSTNSYSVTDPGATEPDYKVSEISMYAPFVTTGSSIEESFTLSNGGAAGSQNVTWTAYASLDTVPEGGEEVGTGAVGPLSAGGRADGISLLGASWPSTPGQYYLIVEESAPDETLTDDYAVSMARFTVEDPPDYLIESVTYPPSAQWGTAVSGGFQIRNNGSGDGKKNVQWEAFLSTDTGFSGDDVAIGSGEIGPLDSGETASIGPGDLSITDWPLFGLGHILIGVTSDDDGVTSNNQYISPATELYILDSEGPDASGPINDGRGKSTGPIADTQDIGTITAGRTLVIRGWLDDSSTKRYDTFAMELGPGATVIRTYATWSTGTDSGELIVWDEFDYEFKSADGSDDREPAFADLPIYGWTPGETAYVSLSSYEWVPTGTEYPYTIYVSAE